MATDTQLRFDFLFSKPINVAIEENWNVYLTLLIRKIHETSNAYYSYRYPTGSH